MRFCPFVLDHVHERVPVSISPMSAEDVAQTVSPKPWQTRWDSDFIADSGFDCYAAKVGGELVALGAYEVLKNSLVVHIAYMEAQPESNPTMDVGAPKYTGIGRMLIAFGIKLSIDNGFGGDVILEAKTTELARHYTKDFGAVRIPDFSTAALRFLIADEAVKRIFLTYLA